METDSLENCPREAEERIFNRWAPCDVATWALSFFSSFMTWLQGRARSSWIMNAGEFLGVGPELPSNNVLLAYLFPSVSMAWRQELPA